jgi:transketolase
MRHQRDAFITEVFTRAKVDNDIFLLSADFGAPALDAFREELPGQFIHCGISEQNMVDLAAGLALDGRRVFCYAMAPFVSLRCLEQHKCSAGIMNLPVCTVVAGVGLGYADAGPTHYATEDLACLRAIVNSHVMTASDAEIARLLAADALDRPRFSFVRLDRQPSTDLSPAARIDDVRRGFRIMRDGRRLAIVSHGFMLGKALEPFDNAGGKGNGLTDIAVIDLIQTKPIPDAFMDYIAKCDAVLTIDEQTPCGGLAAAVLESMADKGIVKPFYRLMLPERYFFENGGRGKLLELAALSKRDIEKKIESIVGAA